MANMADGPSASTEEIAGKGLFFLHIPKTAGSFVAQTFQAALGEDACAVFQERAVQHAISKGQKLPFLGAGFVSAHSPMSALRRAGVPRRYDIFTVLRNPADRLVSHLNWLDRFNHGIDEHSFEALKPEMQKFVRTLDNRDIESVKDMRQLFMLDSLAKARMLFNTQAAMLFSPRAGDILAFADLERLDQAQMREALTAIASISTIDQFKSGLASAGVSIAVEQRVNGQKSNRFKLTPVLEQAARRYLSADTMLYDLISAQEPNLDPIIERLNPALPWPEMQLVAGA